MINWYSISNKSDTVLKNYVVMVGVVGGVMEC